MDTCDCGLTMEHCPECCHPFCEACYGWFGGLCESCHDKVDEVVEVPIFTITKTSVG